MVLSSLSLSGSRSHVPQVWRVRDGELSPSLCSNRILPLGYLAAPTHFPCMEQHINPKNTMLGERTQERGRVRSGSGARTCPSQAIHRDGKQVPGLPGLGDRKGKGRLLGPLGVMPRI